MSRSSISLSTSRRRVVFPLVRAPGFIRYDGNGGMTIVTNNRDCHRRAIATARASAVSDSRDPSTPATIPPRSSRASRTLSLWRAGTATRVSAMGPPIGAFQDQNVSPIESHGPQRLQKSANPGSGVRDRGFRVIRFLHTESTNYWLCSGAEIPIIMPAKDFLWFEEQRPTKKRSPLPTLETSRRRKRRASSDVTLSGVLHFPSTTALTSGRSTTS